MVFSTLQPECSLSPISPRPESQGAVASRQGQTLYSTVCAHLLQTHERVQSLLKKCEGLGKCRFIVIGDGAILESVADFSA